MERADMPDPAEPIRAPQGAIAWTPTDGWLYERAEMPTRIEGGDVVYVVSADGRVRGITPSMTAPLAAVLRIDADLADLVTRLNDLAEAHSDEITELRGRQDALVARVDRATRRQP
jgi:hypothetical protein